MTSQEFMEYADRAKSTGLNIYAIAALDGDMRAYSAQITPANPTK